MSQLRIGVDVGFDHLKVIANGRAFKFPFNVVETDERKLTEYALRDDFLRYIYIGKKDQDIKMATLSRRR